MWSAALFLCFLAGAAAAVFCPAVSVPLSARLPAVLARLLLPCAAAYLCGLTAAGVVLVPCAAVWSGCALSLPVAEAVRRGGTEGFLRALTGAGLMGFAAAPAFFLIAVPAAVCAESAFLRLIAAPRGLPLSVLAPPLPLLLFVTLTALLALAVLLPV